MKIYHISSGTSTEVTLYDSKQSIYTRLFQSGGPVHAGLMRVGRDGVIGKHKAPCRQLFLVCEGSGWVTGSDQNEYRVEAGHLILWEENEEHETRTDIGLTALIFEGEHIDTFLKDVLV